MSAILLNPRLIFVILGGIITTLLLSTSVGSAKPPVPAPKLKLDMICFAPTESLTKYNIKVSGDTTWDPSKIPFTLTCQKILGNGNGNNGRGNRIP